MSNSSLPVLQLAFKAAARPRSNSSSSSSQQQRARQHAFCRHCGSFIPASDSNFVADVRGIYHSWCFNLLLEKHYGSTPEDGSAPLQASPKIDWSGEWYDTK